MKILSAIFLIGMFAVTSNAQGDPLCQPGLLYTQPTCCTMELRCTPPTSSVSNPAEFRAACARQGAKAMCCSVPIPGVLSLLCQDAIDA